MRQLNQQNDFFEMNMFTPIFISIAFLALLIVRIPTVNRTLAVFSKLLFLSKRAILSNPLSKKVFLGGPIYPHIPHLTATNPFGHLDLTPTMSQTLTDLAKTEENGIATFWSGFFPVLYVTSNASRLALVDNNRTGFTTTDEAALLKWMTNNSVMTNFPNFMDSSSELYRAQRNFLLNQYHRKAKNWMITTLLTTQQFLENYVRENRRAISLRELMMLLVLHSSSNFLGLTKMTLDKFYLNANYRHAFDHVAKYGISETRNTELENTLYQLFIDILRENFSVIFPSEENEGASDNLIQNIFSSRKISFPKSMHDFEDLSLETRHAVAMNFAATGLGGMVHSTANSLDWAFAALLQNPDKLDEISTLIAKCENQDIVNIENYDKGGALFPLGLWVMHMITQHPVFAIKFIRNENAFTVTLADQSTITVPSESFTIINFKACNESSQLTDLETLTNSLTRNATLLNFVMSKQNASFGGSDSGKTRRCPGALTSVLEQVVMMGALLRYFVLTLENPRELSLEADPEQFPSHSRYDTGRVFVRKRELAAKSERTFLDENNRVNSIQSIVINTDHKNYRMQ